MTTPEIAYPITKRIDVAEKHFGQTVVEPCCWLENDVHNDDDVSAWVKAHNETTHAHLDKLTGRNIFKYAAVLQVADIAPKPCLARVENAYQHFFS